MALYHVGRKCWGKKSMEMLLSSPLWSYTKKMVTLSKVTPNLPMWLSEFGTSLVITDYPSMWSRYMHDIRITALSVTGVIPFCQRL